jgi:phage terminase large subunit-like protein
VRGLAEGDGRLRIALVAATMGEGRSVMIEGRSGLLGIAPTDLRPEYEPSLRRLTWATGAQAFLYSAAEPEALRGPEHR